MTSFLEFLKKGWTDFKALTALQQVAYLMVMVGILSGLTVAVFYSTRPQYQVLVSNLEPEDAGRVTAYLKDNKVPYKLGAGGTTILVPSKDLYEVRMALASQNMPVGGATGWEIFDAKKMGMTEAEHRVALQRALQGELSRTLQQIDQVEKARVHLVLPEEALFKEDKTEATAAVILKLRGKKELSQNEVDGVVHLVSSAVEGLKPGNVTVMDSRGKVLSRPKEDESSLVGLSSTMLEYKKAIEKDLEQKIVRALSRSVGREKIVASVTADVNFDRTVKRSEKYDADEPAIRSRQTTDENESGNEVNESAAPGMASNVPEGAAEQTKTQTNNQSRRAGETVNYELSNERAEVITPAGEIKRLSVAVLLDGKYEVVPGEKDDAGRPKVKYTPWTTQEIDQFTSLAKTAVGFDDKRGDQIQVTNMSFQGEEPLEGEAMQEEGRDWVITLVRYGLALVGTVLFFFLVLRPLIRWLTTEEIPMDEKTKELLLPGTVAAVEDRLLRATSSVPDVEERNIEEDQLEVMRKQIEERRKIAVESARRDRKAISMIVRKWLKEDQEGRAQPAQQGQGSA